MKSTREGQRELGDGGRGEINNTRMDGKWVKDKTLASIHVQ